MSSVTYIWRKSLVRPLPVPGMRAFWTSSWPFNGCGQHQGFGGDPGNVTYLRRIRGRPKGQCPSTMPAAKGLFHKGIIQSSPALKGMDPKTATAVAERLLAKLEIKANEMKKSRISSPAASGSGQQPCRSVPRSARRLSPPGVL